VLLFYAPGATSYSDLLLFGVVMKGVWQDHCRTRELGTEELLEQLPALQQLLHRLMGCQVHFAFTNGVSF
jgi:hypothetical protein